jgi:hypothetical protein
MGEERTSESAGSRGAGYPAFSLEEAIVRARKFWDAERRNAAPVSAAVKHWGYGEKSSGGKRTISALIQYGLLSDEGSESNRTVKLTPRALDILVGEPHSKIWMTAVREAAISPKIYADLLTRWPVNELPSDASLQHYLVKDKGFNPTTVVQFIKDLRATLEFANLTEQDAVIPSQSVEERASPPTNPLPAPIAEAIERTRVPTPPQGFKQDTFSLDEGQVVLQWPAKMSAESYQDFKDWIELQMRKIARAVEAPPASNS